jgi:hypothetical protein
MDGCEKQVSRLARGPVSAVGAQSAPYAASGQTGIQTAIFAEWHSAQQARIQWLSENYFSRRLIPVPGRIGFDFDDITQEFSWNRWHSG